MWGDLPGAVEGAKLLSEGSSMVGIQYLLRPIAQRHVSITRHSGEAMGKSSIACNDVFSYPIMNGHVTKMAWRDWYSWKTPNEVFENLRFVRPVYGISSPCCLLSESHLWCMWSTFHYQLGRLSQSSKAISPIHFAQEHSPDLVKSFGAFTLHEAAYTTFSRSSSYPIIQRHVTFSGSQDNMEYIGIWHFS